MKRNHRESLQEWNIHSWWLCCGPALSGCVNNNNLSHCNPFICNLLNVCALLCMQAQSAQSSSLYARLCPGLCIYYCDAPLKYHWNTIDYWRLTRFFLVKDQIAFRCLKIATRHDHTSFLEQYAHERTARRKFICYFDNLGAWRENDKCAGHKLANTLATIDNRHSADRIIGP